MSERQCHGHEGLLFTRLLHNFLGRADVRTLIRRSHFKTKNAPPGTSWSMSSTYAHYQGPSSLPSDYAILSRLSSNYESRTPESHPENTVEITRRVTRRESFPKYYNRPLNPTIGVYPHTEASHNLTPSPTETSPLLDHPSVPRIEENIDYNASADNTSAVNMFWEELAVLTKYAIPVFGYAPLFIFHKN